MPKIIFCVLILLMANSTISNFKTNLLVSQLSLIHSAHAAKTKVQKKGTKYTCPMHPHYIANEAGTCPICGMDLVPLQTGGNDTTSKSDNTGSRQAIIVSAETIQNMGIRIAKVEKIDFGRQVRAYGIVKENEKLQQVISNRLDGWIEVLKVRAMGDVVKKGDLLYKIYSPKLYVSQFDYLSDIKGGKKNRVRRKRLSQQLRSYGVQQKVIRQINKTRKIMSQVPFYAPSNGVITELNVSLGSFVKRGAMIAKIQDYSKVWLIVSISEQELGFITKNSQAIVTFPTLKGRKETATIDYIYPMVDAASRTGQIRLVIDNRDGLIRPGTYADIVFNIDSQERLAVPSESLLHGENGRHIVLSQGEGRFQPRSVKTGMTAEGWTEITEGLLVGDNIVVSGQFLLDSESALRESFRKLERLQTPLSSLVLDADQMAMVDHLVDAALYLHESQVKRFKVDRKFIEPARNIRKLLWPKFRHTQLGPILESAEKAIEQAQKSRSRSQTRAALNNLVIALKPWMIEKSDYYNGKNLNLFIEKSKTKGDRFWIQQNKKPLNPYSKRLAKILPWTLQDNQPLKISKQSILTEVKTVSRGSNSGGTGRGSNAK